MNATMRCDKTAGQLFLAGHSGDVILSEGQPVTIVDQQTTGIGECYAIKINGELHGRSYVWVDEQDLILAVNKAVQS